MKYTKKWVAFVVGLAIFSLGTNQVLGGAEKQAKVAILPVKIHAPEKMEYLQAGLMDMLASRIGARDKVEILDRNKVAKASKKFKKDLNETTARSLAADLDADYLVSGSITFFGTGGSIDFKVFSRDEAKPPITIYGLVQDMNNLLPRFSQVVDEINAKAFDTSSNLATAWPKQQAQPGPAVAVAPLPTPKTTASEPQPQPEPVPAPLSAAPTPTQPQMASIKQELIHGQPVSSASRQPTLPPVPVTPQENQWKSQKMDHAMLSMDVGDLLGDGGKELVAINRKKVFVYRHSDQGLQKLAEYRGPKGDRLVWVSVADINQNGRDDILVTSQKKLSASRVKASSFVLEWDGKQFSILLQGLDYYLRAVRTAGKPVSLWGQKSASDGSFLPEIYNLAWQNNTLAPVDVLSFPQAANIYNSTRGDVTAQGESETVMINPKRYLLLFDPRGRPIWRSAESYNATENHVRVEIPATDLPQPVEELQYESGRFDPIRNQPEGVKLLLPARAGSID